MRRPRSAQTMTPVDWCSSPMYFGCTVGGGASLYAATPMSWQPPKRRMRDEGRRMDRKFRRVRVMVGLILLLLHPATFILLSLSPPIDPLEVNEHLPPPGGDEEAEDDGHRVDAGD